MEYITKLEIMWVAFWIIVPVALFVDLVLLNKHKGAVTIKEAGVMVASWISLALIFCAAIFFMLGHGKALEFLTGYAVEYSLSIDNMFVFIMIFTYFATPKEAQPKVLIWGVLGAIALRFIFIFVGVQLISKFDWMIYVFGALLIFTAIKMLLQKESDMDPSKNIAFKLLKKIFPFKADYKGTNFFIKENAKLYATPILAAVVVVEMSDVIFAVDSIPAVLSISTDTFIVYTSNIFAIMGLRSLYFLLAGMAGKFPYLKYGIAGILIFVGAKMLLHSVFPVKTIVSLAVIVTVVAGSIAVSLIWPPKEEEAKA
ncbi:tellurite resistance protein TerC [Parelusimicrobium proximum]|uniref:TerC family protein n=1 Tax=Parelusimicrobium proximum TaxID=3228953 RepID=UPI003D1734B3